ncbi:glycosyltransferase family 39 protein [Leptolyngbya sp. AN03gr2]|uniref:glycosyltransferase family 39 protein n=1 Tax=unclassified Leptolyngbya TaxID=2650499 RepID=UPI003D311889
MNTKLLHYWNSLDRALKALVVVLLILGIFFRCTALAERPYWHDEAFTLIRSAGYTTVEITQSVFNGQLIDRSELLQFQQVTPERTWVDTIRALLAEEPHRGALYPLIARDWMQWIGSDVVSMRSLSVLLSLLVFPALFWLCIELFAQPLTAWIAVMLMAVSPFHVYYAQEVREYALWTVAILVMSAALLRAIRVQTKATWSIYSLSIVATLYTMILSVPLVMSQVVYQLYRDKIRKGVLISASVALPWFVMVALNFSEVRRTSAWMTRSIPVLELLEHWMTNFQVVFLTENLTGRFNLLFASAIALLVFLSIKSLIQQTPKAVWSFVLLLILPLVLCIAVPDLVSGGIRSTNSRYFVPTYLGIQIAVAYLLATRIQSGRYRTFWKLTLFVVLTAGVLSCSAQVFQNQIEENKAIAELINQSQTPIVISNEVSTQGEGTIGDILALSHLVRPETQFQLVIQPQVPSIPNQPNLYLYKPLSYLQNKLEETYQLQPIYKNQLFRILPK